MVYSTNAITINPEILGGQPVFTGTRVPVESLFDHLASGVTLEDFLSDFPSVSKQHAIEDIELAAKCFINSFEKGNEA